MEYMEQLGKRAQEAKKVVQFLGTNERNKGLLAAADELEGKAAFIIEENKKDILDARSRNLPEPLIDRLMLGYVTDMIDFRVFPVFNVADIAVTVGCVLLALWILKTEDRGKGEQ